MPSPYQALVLPSSPFAIWSTRSLATSAEAPRTAAGTGGDTDDAQAAEEEAREVSRLRNLQGIGTLVGLCTVGYGAWVCTSFVMKMVGTVYANPHLVAYGGFVLGFGTASLCALLAISLYRMTIIRPEFAWKDTFNVIKNDPKVQHLLGGKVSYDKFRTYEISGGRLSLAHLLPRWVPHRVQLMYKIRGEHGDALVTAVCVKRVGFLPRKLDIDLLAVDPLDAKNVIKQKATLLLIGEESQLQLMDSIRRVLELRGGHD